MAKIKIDHDHGLAMEQAREKLEQLAERLRDKYKLKLAWSGDKVNIKGLGIKGDLILVEGNLSGTLDVPFILKSKVEKKLDEEIGVEFPPEARLYFRAPFAGQTTLMALDEPS